MEEDNFKIWHAVLVFGVIILWIVSAIGIGLLLK
jgi:hypothetical protein